MSDKKRNTNHGRQNPNKPTKKFLKNRLENVIQNLEQAKLDGKTHQIAMWQAVLDKLKK